jgi:hypothetical protein
MSTSEEWAREQLKPLSMFGIAKWWADGLKVLGAGNGAGFLTSGAALSPFHDHYRALFVVKIAGACFFVGIITFAVAFLFLHIASHAQDEIAQGTLHKDKPRIIANVEVSGTSMELANKLAIISTIAFFVGCFTGLVAFLSY